MLSTKKNQYPLWQSKYMSENHVLQLLCSTFLGSNYHTQQWGGAVNSFCLTCYDENYYANTDRHAGQTQSYKY